MILEKPLSIFSKNGTPFRIIEKKFNEENGDLVYIVQTKSSDTGDKIIPMAIIASNKCRVVEYSKETAGTLREALEARKTWISEKLTKSDPARKEIMDVYDGMIEKLPKKEINSEVAEVLSNITEKM